MKKNTAYIMFFSILLFFATGCCKKELNLKEASKAYLKGDYKEAAEIFLPKAKTGDAEAMVNIAFMYYCGMHVNSVLPHCMKTVKVLSKTWKKHIFGIALPKDREMKTQNVLE